LYNKSLALIGTGQIGSKVAKAARGLGVKVKGYSPNFNPQRAKELDIEHCSSLESAIKNADIVSVQVPYVTTGLNPTFKLIGENQIKLLNNGAFIINVSRLDVIDINPLAESLDSGKLAGIAIDTMPSEISSLVSNYPSLVKHDNVYLTPSIATASVELKNDLTYQTLMRIFWYFEEDNIVDQVKR
jgi:D-3-phosphoglycerate dehydrogenase